MIFCDWQPYQNLLVQLVKPKNIECYDWHGETWTDLFGLHTEQIHTCMICESIVSKYPIILGIKNLIEKELKEHGIQHLKEMNLLSFI